MPLFVINGQELAELEKIDLAKSSVFLAKLKLFSQKLKKIETVSFLRPLRSFLGNFYLRTVVAPTIAHVLK